MNEIVIRARDFGKSYGSGPRALEGFSLEVSRGQIHALLGPNGAGKTTALRAFAGLIRPGAGSVELLGVEPWGMPPEVRRRVGFLAARSSVYPWMTVADTIAFVAGLHGEGFDRAGAERLRQRLELPADKRARELSLGLQRRLGLLLAVAPRPEVLLLDEPAGGLDPLARREMLEIVLEGVRERGTTVLYSTHILSDVERVAGDVSFVAGGRVLTSRSLDHLKEAFRRARLIFEGAAPDAARIAAEPGVLAAKVEGREALVTVDLDDVETALPALAARLGARVESTFALDLEEIYVALMKRADARVEVAA